MVRPVISCYTACFIRTRQLIKRPLTCFESDHLIPDTFIAIRVRSLLTRFIPYTSINYVRLEISRLLWKYLIIRDPPRLRTGAMLIIKCFSTIAYSLPREMGYLTLKEFFKSDQLAPEISAFKQTNSSAL
jgi:hypothetical protein